jgi:nitroreductase
VWSFNLALRARGLGTTVTTIHLARETDAAEILGIPDDVTQAALLPVGYTTGEGFRPAKRPPAEEITYWDDWGRTVSP